MSRHGGGISISLDDLLTLPTRLEAMKQGIANSKQQQQEKAQEFEQQMDQYHEKHALDAGFNYGWDSPQMAHEMDNNPWIKKEGLQGTRPVLQDDGSVMFRRPDGSLIHTSDLAVNIPMQRSGAAKIEDQPFKLTKEHLAEAYRQFSKPTDDTVNAQQTRYLNVGTPYEREIKGPDARQTVTYRVGGGTRIDPKAVWAKNFDQLMFRNFGDPVGRGELNPQGQRVYAAAAQLAQDPQFAAALDKSPESAHLMLYDAALKAVPQQQDTSGAPPWGDAAKAENTGATSPTPEKPKTLADEINSVDQGVAAAPGLKERAQQQKMKSVANQAQTYFMQHYKNIASMSGAGTLTRQQRVQQAIDQTMNEPNLQSLSPEYTKAVREQLLEDAMGTNPAPTPSPVPQPTPAAPTPTAAPAVPGRPTAMADQPDQQQQGFAKGGKVEKVMHEWKTGKLHSGSKNGPVVTKQKQAVAIALSEAGKAQRGLGFAPRSR